MSKIVKIVFELFEEVTSPKVVLGDSCDNLHRFHQIHAIIPTQNA